MSGQAGAFSLESLQDDMDSRPRPPTSSTSDYSEHSFHMRSKSSAYVHSPKRLSVFSGRSRSNTTTSTTSPRRSPASSQSGAEGSVTAPVDDKAAPADNVAKSLLIRGSRILRRQGSKLNVAPTLDEEDESGKGAVRFEVANIFQRNPKLKRADSHEQLKRIISEPYNFHHLIHTNSNQFQTLDNANNFRLMDEFSALQAAQSPEPGLKGIRALDLPSTNASSECLDEAGTEARSKTASPTAISPPASPRSPGKVENFSRPVSRMNKPLPPSPSIVPPPRVSSRQGYIDIPEPTSLAIDELLGLNPQPTMPSHIYPYESYEDIAYERRLQERIDGTRTFQPEVGYAITTAQNEDDTKITTAFINSYLSDLEDVPEEDETKIGSRLEPGSAQASPVFDNEGTPPAVAPQTCPPPRHESVIVVHDTRSSFPEDLMSPTLPQFRPTLQDSPMSQESVVKNGSPPGGFEEFLPSWDEDIDYCYEHAAEADCEFDWNRSSLDVPRRSIASAVPLAQNVGKSLRVAGPQAIISIPPTPDLAPGSAQSVMTRSHEAITPLSDGATPLDLFPTKAHNPQFFNLQTNEMGNDASYEDLLLVQDEAEGQFEYFAQRSHSVDFPVSPRSSYSPISKCNSQESVILSRAASIVRKHRSSTSTTSVPELVHSANNSHREKPTRESIESFENAFPGPIPESYRTGFSYHRQVKSLAPELSLFSNLRTTRSSGSIDVSDLRSPTHDRTKSVSALDHEKENTAQAPENPPSVPRPMSLAQKRKSRAGYSLFPSANTVPQRQ